MVLTTHYLEEAEALADRIAVISNGRIVAEGSPATLGGRDRAAVTVTMSLDRPVPDGAGAPQLCDATTLETDGRQLRMETTDPLGDLHALTEWLLSVGVAVSHFDARRPTLEATYLELTDRHDAGAKAMALGPTIGKRGLHDRR